MTGSTANSWNKSIKLPSYMKLYIDLWQNGIFCNVITLVLTVGALFYSSAVIWSPNYQCLITKLVTSLAWPPLLHICYLSIANNCVPVAYLLNPPQYPDRKAKAPQQEPRDMKHSKWSTIDKAGREMLSLGKSLDLVDESEI